MSARDILSNDHKNLELNISALKQTYICGAKLGPQCLRAVSTGEWACPAWEHKAEFGITRWLRNYELTALTALV